jgi:hypothetical protein
MERNAGRRQVKVSKLMARKAFRMGFEDKRKGVWRGDDLAVLDHKGSLWTYERVPQIAEGKGNHMSKDQWIADHERILEDYASRIIDYGEAKVRLTDLGLPTAEAEIDLLECDK